MRSHIIAQIDPRPRLRAILGFLSVSWLAIGLLGCAALPRGPAVPLGLASRAITPESPSSRYWPSIDITPMLLAAIASDDREKVALARVGQAAAQLPVANYLAISGGGDSGVFGAGLLVGWSAHGDRPIFKVVTGVSAGALIAPFAFLGAKYDKVLKEASTSISRRSLFRPHNILVTISGEAYADDRPLASFIAKIVTRELLDEIAAQYANGRLLLVATTDLDAGQPVVWNMGEIASSPDPGALVLFRKVLLASAAIPGFFPPVMIDAEVDGKHYQEMHVDGGVVNQVFFAPPQLVQELNVASNQYLRERHLYIIRNGRIQSEGSAVSRRTAQVARRAVRTLIDSQGLSDLYRLESIAQRENERFRVAYVDSAFSYPHRTAFESEFMTHLFEYGYEIAARGNPWHEQLPGDLKFPENADINGPRSHSCYAK